MVSNPNYSLTLCDFCGTMYRNEGVYKAYCSSECEKEAKESPMYLYMWMDVFEPAQLPHAPDKQDFEMIKDGNLRVFRYTAAGFEEVDETGEWQGV
jgi:hypothetical protein